MKIYIIFMAFTLSFSVIFFSCSLGECANKSTYLNSFEFFIEDIEKNSKEFSVRDWERAEEKFKRLTEECYEKFQNELTISEEGKIIKYSLKFAFYKLNNELSLELTEDKMESLHSDMEKFLESGKDFKDSLNIYLNSEEFKDAMEEFGKGMEQLGKGIEKFVRGLKQVYGDNDINKQ